MQRILSMLKMLTLGLALALAAQPAFAFEPDEILPDAAMEQRARELSLGLRCLVCQNQSIDDSHAPLARDLRLLVRERIKAGDSDDAVLDFVVARYGDFVLLKPPMRGSTLILWLTPVVVLIGGILLATTISLVSAILGIEDAGSFYEGVIERASAARFFADPLRAQISRWPF